MRVQLPKRWSVLSITLVCLQGQATAHDEGNRQRSRQTVQEHIESLSQIRLGNRLKLQDLEAEYFEKTFGNCDYFLLRYSRFPIEVVPVAPLGVNNVYVVCDGRINRISSEDDLRDFFLKNFPVSADPDVRMDGVRTWLRLTQELLQDGYMEFGRPSFNATKSLVSGVVEVISGGRGSASVKMEFSDGKLARIRSENNVAPGVRTLK